MAEEGEREMERGRQGGSEDECLVPKAACVFVCVCVSISALSQLNNDK